MRLRRALSALLAVLLCSSVLAFVLLVAQARKTNAQGYTPQVGGLCQPSTMLCSSCMVYYDPTSGNCTAVTCGTGALPPKYCACQYTGSTSEVCNQFTAVPKPIPAPGCGPGFAWTATAPPSGSCNFVTLGGCSGPSVGFTCGTGTIQGCGGNGSGC